MNNKYLITIVGPTAIGKTAMAIHLANTFNAEIISADSRQFFKEMAIGTAKPTIEERSQAIHHFVDNLSIEEYYSTGDFERDVISFLDEYFKTHDVAIMCGGSGLYVNAVLNGIDEFPEIDPKFREEVIALFETEGIESLQKILQEKDPEHFARVDINNPQRLMRAVEVCLGTEQKYSSFLRGKKTQRAFTSIKIGLELEREKIYERINRRVDIMLEQGLLQEVKDLNPKKDLNALQTVGYKEFFDHFAGIHDYDTAVELVKRNTRRFAKKQLTWFKKDEETQWFSPLDQDKIIEFILSEFEKQPTD